MKGGIVSRGLLTLGLTVILLAATAATASATRILTPTSADFGNRQVGTSSPAQAFTLRVRCTQIFGGCFANDTFNPSISVSGGGDYAQTNNCPATLQGLNQEGQSCIINVTFTPTSTGPKEGTLSTGSGGPTAALTGNGVTTPTPPTPPTPGPDPSALRLDLDAKKQELKKKVKFFAESNEDATLVVGGGVKTSERELVAGDRRKVKVKPKKRRQLVNKLATTGKAKVKVQAEAISESGAIDTDQVKVKLRA